MQAKRDMITNIEVKFQKEYPRLCFAEMPILCRSMETLFDYDMDSDMALTIPVFNAIGTPKYKNVTEIRVHGFAKRAVWLAWELLHFTDFRQQGVTLYISATRSVQPILEPYLEACQFPSAHVLWSDIADGTYLGNVVKFPLIKAALRNPKIQRVMHFDSAIYFLHGRHSDIFQKLKNVWTGEIPMASFFPVWNPAPDAPNDYGDVDYNRCRLSDVKLAAPEFYERLADVVGCSVAAFKTFWGKKSTGLNLQIEGRTLGTHRNVLAADTFWHLIADTKAYLGNDEAITCLYWQKYLGKRSDIVVPQRIHWYPRLDTPDIIANPAAIKGHIGFLDSSASLGETSRHLWKYYMEQNNDAL